MTMHGFYSNGILTNPLANAILADTGPAIVDDTHDITLLVSATVAAFVSLERRNAANDATVWSHAFPVGPNAPLVVHVGNTMQCLQDERFRIRVVNAVVGMVQGSLNIG